MSATASQITGISTVYSTVCSGTDQSKHQGPASLAFVSGIPRARGQYRGKCLHLITSSYSNVQVVRCARVNTVHRVIVVQLWFVYLWRPLVGIHNLGPVSLTAFPSQFKFDGNFVSLSSRFWYIDRYKILYMARQLCCRGMCKNLLRSDDQQRNYSKANFPSNLNCGQNIVSETGPRP